MRQLEKLFFQIRSQLKNSWDEFFESMAKRVAEAPEEFEEFGKFIDNRDKSPPKDRHLFDDYDE
jgi:hypothetical protein